MDTIIPNKLKVGDEIRVISLSTNMNILGEDSIKIATDTLSDMGLKVTFGKNIYNSCNEEYMIPSIKDRIDDLHEAFSDKNVKAIISIIGGYNSNQILNYIDYDLIKNNPKIICGYSDITAVLDSIYAKTGLITYYGPHYSSFGMKYGKEYIEEYFNKMLFDNSIIDVIPSKQWSNDLWFIDQENRNFIKNNGFEVINKGYAYGKIIGGNLCTLNLLQGTEYMPLEQDVILFIEDDGSADGNFLKNFDRNFQSLIDCIGIKNIKGIVVGRAESNCNMTFNKWKMIFDFRDCLKNIPIIINADFGHTTPMITFPIGGYAKIDTSKDIILKISDMEF